MKKKQSKGATIMNNGTVKAVHDSDIEKLLVSLQCYEDVLEGKAKCDVCGNQINMENILAVFPKKGKVCFCCDNQECYAELLRRGGKEIE